MVSRKLLARIHTLREDPAELSQFRARVAEIRASRSIYTTSIVLLPCPCLLHYSVCFRLFRTVRSKMSDGKSILTHNVEDTSARSPRVVADKRRLWFEEHKQR